jgi:hypothetical protein
VIFGTAATVQAALANSLVSREVNTAFIERHNGTDRDRTARKVRRKMYCSWKDWWIHRAVTFFTLYSSNFLKELIRHVGSSQSGAQSIVYELDTSQHKARLGLEQLSLVILCSCTNKSQTTTTEQCQVAAGSIWDGPPRARP